MDSLFRAVLGEVINRVGVRDKVGLKAKAFVMPLNYVTVNCNQSINPMASLNKIILTLRSGPLFNQGYIGNVLSIFIVTVILVL